MSLTRDRSDEFIELIYEAAEHPSQWKAFCEELQRVIEVQSIHMLAIDRRNGTLSYSDGANMPVEGEISYLQQYRHLDPRLPILLANPLGGWMHCHENVPEDVVREHPFYQDFLIPYDRRFTSGIKLVDNDDATIIFAVLTSAAQGPVSGETLEFLDHLVPHLRRACRISIRNFVYSTQALVGHMLVSKLRQPVMLMNPDGLVMHTNEAAQALMRSTPLVRVEGGKLQLPPGPARELLQACAALELQEKSRAGSTQPPSQQGTGVDGGDFRSLRVEAEGRVAEPLYLFYTLLSPQAAMGSFGLRPVVMLLFYHPSSAPAIDSGLLYAAFGLSPAECRIASLLAEGLSLKEIASRQGTQHDTIRKQLRSIYQKTATHRQPDLIRLLLHLPHNAVQT
jgi:DNA-binding CsgD family transcriptional regulator